MAEYVEVKLKREPDPFLFEIDELRSDGEYLVGNAMDQRGHILKENDRILRDRIHKIGRAVRAETMGGGIIIVPVKPIG